MKAAVVFAFGPSKNIKILNDYTKPTILDHECLINVKIAGVNPVDTYIREGKYPVLPELPYIPGREGSGVVVQVTFNKFFYFLCLDWTCIQRSNLYWRPSLVFKSENW